MKIKLDIDLSLSPRAKRAVRRVVLPILTLCGAFTVAHAALDPAPSDWAKSGASLSASALSSNLNALDTRLAALEFPPVVHSFSLQRPTGGGIETLHPDGASVQSFAKAGLYKITLNSHVDHTSLFSGVYAAWQIATSATRIDSQHNCRNSAAADPQNETQSNSCVILVRAAAGDSLSLQPDYFITHPNDGGLHTFYFDYLVERIGN